jgi:hypothetical protein
VEPPPDQARMGPSGSEAKLWSSYSKTNTACPPGPLKKGIWKGKVESVGDNITISHDTITRYPTPSTLYLRSPMFPHIFHLERR